LGASLGGRRRPTREGRGAVVAARRRVGACVLRLDSSRLETCRGRARMRKLMKPLLLSVGLFVCPALAICQQPVPATLSLADAIALAREHNPAYRQTIHDRSP